MSLGNPRPSFWKIWPFYIGSYCFIANKLCFPLVWGLIGHLATRDNFILEIHSYRNLPHFGAVTLRFVEAQKDNEDNIVFFDQINIAMLHKWKGPKRLLHLLLDPIKVYSHFLSFRRIEFGDLLWEQRSWNRFITALCRSCKIAFEVVKFDKSFVHKIV